MGLVLRAEKVVVSSVVVIDVNPAYRVNVATICNLLIGGFQLGEVVNLPTVYDAHNRHQFPIADGVVVVEMFPR